VRPREPRGEQVQLGLAIAELFERADRRNDVVAVGAGLAVPLAHVMQLLLERETSCVLHVSTIYRVTEGRHPPLGLVLEPDRTYAFAVDGRHLLARPQIGDGVAALLCRYTIGDAATGPAMIEPEHQTWPLGRPAMDKGVDAKRPVRAEESGLDPLNEGKIRPPHQRTVSEHPEVFGSVCGIRIHTCDIEEYGGPRKLAIPPGISLVMR
jgi:hypothetical protein